MASQTDSLLTEREKRLKDALYIFCVENDIESVKICLSRGANVNWSYKGSNSPLHYAILKNSEELLDLLLSQLEVDVNVIRDITKQCRQILLEAKPLPIHLIRFVDMTLLDL